MRTEVIEFGGHAITYYVWGHGPKLVLMLHGYGESGFGFHSLAESFPAAYTLIALDLPFHGKSSVRNPPVSPGSEGGAWVNIVQVGWFFELLQFINTRESFARTAVLLGYSMGGRICLQLYQCYPRAYEHIVLIAPDGMKENFWYWLATQTSWGNKLFRLSVTSPRWFITIVRWADKLKMVNPGIAKYVAKFLNDEQVRMDLYMRWTAFKEFRPQLNIIKNQVRALNTSVLFVYGKYDKIMRPTQANQFRAGIEHQAAIQLIKAGHQLLQPTFADQISGAVLATAPSVKR